MIWLERLGWLAMLPLMTVAACLRYWWDPNHPFWWHAEQTGMKTHYGYKAKWWP